MIGATRTRTGLRVRAELDRGCYPLGVKVSDKQLAAVPVRRHQWHGEWNYGILPKAAEHDQNATLSCWAPGRFLPVAGWRLRVVVVMVVDDAGAGRSQSAGGAVPDPQAWDHIPPCGSEDLAVSVRWERAAVGLEGQILVENIGGRTCRLSDKPSLVPLGTDGRELPVEVFLTADARLRPVILSSGGRAAAPVGWAGWCGDAASGVVRVNWFSGSTVVEVEGPRQPDCPDPGQPTNLSSSWFDTLD